jgi:glycoside/pentoside/hexuronide:cation symporter, GPH family
MTKKPSLPLSKQVAYAIGQLGWSTLINIISFHHVFFYLPPDSEGLPSLIVKVAFWGLSTIGFVAAFGRLWDAITDPLVANKSDQWVSKWGRRIPFLAVGGVPAAFFCAMVFFPPDGAETTGNLIWMTVALVMFYLFLTVYVTPYFALIPELGHTAEERLNLSTFISVTYALGIVVASAVPQFAGILQEGFGLSKFQAFQYAIAALCAFSAFCMYFPVFAIDEKKYCESVPSTIPFAESMKMTFKNKDFLFFAFSDLNYFLAVTMLTTGINYYITQLLNEDISLVSQILPVMLVSSFVCYPIVNLLARVMGKKNLVMVGFLFFVGVFLYIFFLGSEYIPLSGKIQAYLLVIVAGVPMAILGILPNAILADIAELDALKTGSRREGLFYAARTLMQKFGQTMAVLIFSSLILMGGGIKKVETIDPVTQKIVVDRASSNLIGVQITGPVAAGFCVLAIFLFSRYKERETLAEIEKYYKAT